MKNNKYSYAILKHNCAYLERESVLLENKYKVTKKYALIEKLVHKDGSENIANIYYSNDLEILSNRAKNFISWYIYPLGLCKNMQGYIRDIDTSIAPQNK